MITKISLGIPFYNSSEYIFDVIKNALNDDFIDEIVICDDKSDQNHIFNLYQIICSLSNTSKIKIVQNDFNFGAYKNKYRTVQNCKCDWVYLLDSDNYFKCESLDIIKKLNYDKSVIYFPKVSRVFPDGYNVEYDMFKRVDFNFAKNLINNKPDLINCLKMLLNGGNFIVNKNEYIRTQQNFFENYEEVFGADVIAFSYYWLKNENSYEVVDGFEYYHRKRADSIFSIHLYESMDVANCWINKYLED